MPDPRQPTVVALTGFMAAGKSTAGRALAKLLGWQFIDLDGEIEKASRQTIPQIFAEHGEAHFRRLESQVLRTALEGMAGPCVIALGGGAFVQTENAELLRRYGARIVFLELPLEQLLDRCRAGATENDRPLARDEQAFRALHAQRLPFYRQADLTVDAHGKTPEQIAGKIAEALGLRA